ncbi:MAG: cell division protein FtsL [Pseudomonadota bacterium]
MNSRFVIAAVVFVSVIVTSISVVYVKHRNRALFVELQLLERERDRLNTEWTKLRLESSAWATHDRLEQVASKRLSLRVPRAEDMEVVR